ncbi:uncharacterized protein LOC110815738 [Carica papaya]|uniref:uncharacterized protein LOC110815738 n=1 Tax=Carica papaya TaxID=3649 RepID=UPI000B8C962B|nr:uncharacterized protein LOC110815738 [Carica papaya]
MKFSSKLKENYPSLNATRVADNFMEENLHYVNSSDQIMKKKEGLCTQKLKKSLECSLNDFDSHADAAVKHGEKLKNNHAVVNSHDRQGKSISAMLAPAVPKKLWDGLLHLSSSITVSAVAFFKSGDKMPDVNWSDSVEVKGKVKLEAFEKFIQDLPRSRNRRLMVISLCWKEGSSSTGLAELKEVAKGYKEGGRVGIAQLSPGIDLYICPRTDTIITILAKHGFFKGMNAVEDNQDSLVGCVVWRRNQAPSASAAMKSDKKIHSSPKRPSNSASDSSNKRVKKKHLPGRELDNESVATTSGTALYSNDSSGNESKNAKTSEVDIELQGISSSGGKFLPAMSVQSNSSSLSRSLVPSPCSPSTSLHGVVEQSLETRTFTEEMLVMQKPKINLELQRHEYNLPPPIIETQVSTPDDDDLPEFDFGYACGTSRTSISKSVHAAIVDMVHSTDGMKEMAGIFPKKMPTLLTRGVVIIRERQLGF